MMVMCSNPTLAGSLSKPLQLSCIKQLLCAVLSYATVLYCKYLLQFCSTQPKLKIYGIFLQCAMSVMYECYILSCS